MRFKPRQPLRLRYRLAVLLIALLPTLVSPTLHAHGDLHDQIESLTAQINLAPNQAALWFRRGLLHEQHGDHQAALNDLRHAEKLDPAIPGLSFARARAHFGLKEFPAALSLLDAVPAPARDDADWFLWTARTLRHLNRLNEAVAAFTQAVERMDRVSPDVLLERTDCQLQAGRWRSAVAGLDEGIQRVGPVLTLQVKALEIERDHGEWNAALIRLDSILKTVPGSPEFLFQKGEVLIELGRRQEAHGCFQAALRELERLPESRRQTPNNLRLAETLHEQVAALQKPE